MIILDTNVLSAMMQDKRDPAVARWLDGLPAESVWTTSINVYELRYGIELLTVGRKRRSLEAALDRLLQFVMDARVLPFDTAAAERAGQLAAAGRKAGRPTDTRDVQIAGIAAARKATLATRNIRHFEAAGLSIIDPWSF